MLKCQVYCLQLLLAAPVLSIAPIAVATDNSYYENQIVNNGSWVYLYQAPPKAFVTDGYNVYYDKNSINKISDGVWDLNLRAEGVDRLKLWDNTLRPATYRIDCRSRYYSNVGWRISGTFTSNNAGVKNYAKIKNYNEQLYSLLCVNGDANLVQAIRHRSDEATAAYSQKDYTKAFNIWTVLAQQGDAEAQSHLGQMYAAGEGVAQDFGVAGAWWRKAADQGFAPAQYSLGVMFANGAGVTQDQVAAVGWWRKAADQGYALAQYNLGLSFAKGLGIMQDFSAANIWWRKAADQGDAKSQFNLGLMYGKGAGVARDYAEAYKWFNLSASNATDEQQRNAAIEGRNASRAKMTPAEIAMVEGTPQDALPPSAPAFSKTRAVRPTKISAPDTPPPPPSSSSFRAYSSGGITFLCEGLPGSRVCH